MREQTADGDARREDGWLRNFGKRQPIHRAVEDQFTQRLAKRGIGFGERLRANLKLVSEGLAHADRLRPLTRKDERDHGWLAANARISVLSRSII